MIKLLLSVQTDCQGRRKEHSITFISSGLSCLYTMLQFITGREDADSNFIDIVLTGVLNKLPKFASWSNTVNRN